MTVSYSSVFKAHRYTFSAGWKRYETFVVQLNKTVCGEYNKSKGFGVRRSWKLITEDELLENRVTEARRVLDLCN
jgi:hypothetical protein